MQIDAQKFGALEVEITQNSIVNTNEVSEL